MGSCGRALTERCREQPDFKGPLSRRGGNEDTENFENVFQNSSVENNRSPLDGVFCRERGIHLKETGGRDGAGFHYRTATRNWQNEGNVTLSFLRLCQTLN